MKNGWTVAITGASGVVYGRRLVQVLASRECHIHLVISSAGFRVLLDECGDQLSPNETDIVKSLGLCSGKVTIHDDRNLGACIASGSFLSDGMVICPCSMNTLAAIACGLGDTLIHRAAGVTIKEGRPLVLVPRESPLSPIHLENMLKLSRMGVRIAPAMPGFYHRPSSIESIIDMMVMRIMDQMGIHVPLVSRWDTTGQILV